MSFEPRVLRRCLRPASDRRAWTFADLLKAPDGRGDPEVFDALYDTFCDTVGAASCTVTDPDEDGRVWFDADAVEVVRVGAKRAEAGESKTEKIFSE